MKKSNDCGIIRTHLGDTMKKFKIIDLNDVTRDDIIVAINHNSTIFKLMKKDIERIKEEEKARKEKKKRIQPQKKLEQGIEISTKPMKKEDSVEEEINYYIQNLKTATKDDVEEGLVGIIPSRKNYNYKKIIYNLQLYVKKSLFEIKELLEESTSKDELEYLKEELELENKKYQILIKALKEEKEEKETKIENELIFVPTESGNLRAIEELSKIDMEYYDGFIGLLQSIKDGTFKSVKRFTKNITELSGLSEVRDTRIRIVFDRLDKNHYAIITAFVKKSDNDRGYQEPLKKKAISYRGKQTSLKKSLNNEEFLEENRKQTQQLLEMLERKEKRKRNI